MKAEEKIYKVFYGSGKEWLYFTEIRNLTKLSNSSLQNALLKLLNSKKIEEDKQTSNVYYKISNAEKPEIYNTLDKERLNKLNSNIKIPLKNFLKEIPSELAFIILFGSSSRRQEKPDSDIDLLVVLHKFEDSQLQKLYEKEIKQKLEKLRKKVNSESNHPLNIVYINLDVFKTPKDHLITQAKNYGFPISGNLKYYKENEKN